MRQGCLPLIVLSMAAVSCGGFSARRAAQRGDAYLANQRYEAAIIEYRNAIELDATFGDARKRLAQSYARTGNLAGAFDEFVRAADLLPTDVEVQLDAGNVRLDDEFIEVRTRPICSLNYCSSREPTNCPCGNWKCRKE